jgi:putative nucleotidyltransferase with HDIG domain
MTDVVSVLIVDDEPSVRDLMARWVSSLGLEPTTARNSDEALDRLRNGHHDLAVIDVMMPGRNGMWLASEVRRQHPHTAVVIATAHTELLDEAPVADLLIKPFKRERFVLALDRGRQWRQRTLAEVEWHARLNQELRAGIEAVRATIVERRSQGESDETILVNFSAQRMPEVLAHSERVARYSVSLATELRLDALTIPLVERAGRFHDIGKAAVPESLLTKPSPMTMGEAAIMRRHAEAGAAILNTTSLRDVAPIVLASHEWYNGGGYPARLASRAIPFESRVIAVADAYDAMTHSRAYRDRLNVSEAVSELLRCSGSQFDPDIVTAFLNVLGRH